jgi:hypothetical protein
MVCWQKDHHLGKKLFAKTDLLFLNIAIDNRRNTAEEVCYAGDFKFINHIRP